MKEFIEKLIGRLEEYRRLCKNTNIPSDMVVESCINIFNELAEEYKNDVCEWRKDKIMSGMYVACSGYVTHLKNFKFCPYCGKKIKVAPYQPKGE